jgi:hypothetical protein
MVNVVDSDKEDAPAKTLSTVKEPQCLVFEWRDHDLRHVPLDRFRQNSILPKVIARSVLSVLAVIHSPYHAIDCGE